MPIINDECTNVACHVMSHDVTQCHIMSHNVNCYWKAPAFWGNFQQWGQSRFSLKFPQIQTKRARKCLFNFSTSLAWIFHRKLSVATTLAQTTPHSPIEPLAATAKHFIRENYAASARPSGLQLSQWPTWLPHWPPTWPPNWPPTYLTTYLTTYTHDHPPDHLPDEWPPIWPPPSLMQGAEASITTSTFARILFM